MGAVLVDLGWATPDDVLAALAEQVRRRAQSCLRWAGDESDLRPSSAFVGGVIEHPWQIPPLVFTGLRASASFELLLPALDAEAPRFVALAPRFERHRAAFVEVFGPLLPAQIARGRGGARLRAAPRGRGDGRGAGCVAGQRPWPPGGKRARLRPAGAGAAPPINDFEVSPGSFKIVPGAARIDPLGAELAFNEACAWIAAGQLPAAVVHLRQAVALRPDQAAYHAWLGWTLFEIDGKAALPEALERLEHAVMIDPDSADSHTLLARTLLTLADGGGAQAHFERTLALTTRPARGHRSPGSVFT